MEFFDRDHFRANLLEYTEQAYNILPVLDNPRILDIGCGSGVVSLRLAELSCGTITCIDINSYALDKLRKNVINTEIEDNLTILHKSMIDLDFPPGSFDIVWSEGTSSVIGFKNAIKSWKQFLTKDGYMVIHDSLSIIPKDSQVVINQGYHLLARFDIPQKIWWQKYYQLLIEQNQTFKEVNNLSAEIKDEIHQIESEIRQFSFEDPKCASAFVILQLT